MTTIDHERIGRPSAIERHRASLVRLAMLVAAMVITCPSPAWAEVLCPNCGANDWQATILVYPEDDSDGLRLYTCGVCGYSYTAVILSLIHI